MKKVLILLLLSMVLTGCNRKTEPEIEFSHDAETGVSVAETAPAPTSVSNEVVDKPNAEGCPIPEEWRRDVVIEDEIDNFSDDEIGDMMLDEPILVTAVPESDADSHVADIKYTITADEMSTESSVYSVSMLGVTFRIPSGYRVVTQREYDVLLTNDDADEIQIQLNSYVNNVATDDKWDEWMFWNSTVTDLGSTYLKYRAEYYHTLNDWQLLFLISCRTQDESCKDIVNSIVDSASGEFDFAPIADLELSDYGTLAYKSLK